MVVRYVDCGVIFRASMMYSEYKRRAQRILGNDFQTPESVLEMIRIVQRRRKRYVHPKLFSTLGIQKIVGKTPLDFKKCFTVGSTGYHADDQCLENLYDGILNDMEMYDTDPFDEERARVFRAKVYRAVRHNKVHLGMILDRLENGDFVFKNELEKEADGLSKAIKKRLKEPRFKFEIATISEDVVHGVSSGLDFVVVCGEPEIMKLRKLNKIRGVLKKEYGRDSGDLIMPIEDVW